MPLFGPKAFCQNRGDKEKGLLRDSCARPVRGQMGIVGLGWGSQPSPASVRMSVSTWTCGSLVFELSRPNTWQLPICSVIMKGAAIRRVGGRQSNAPRNGGHLCWPTKRRRLITAFLSLQGPGGPGGVFL